MNNAELLYNHYKDSCDICRKCEQDRNKLFATVFVLLIVLFLFLTAESSTVEIIQAVVKEKYKINLSLSIDIMQSAVWLLLLYYTIRYYQLSIQIERLYIYIHKTEEKISELSSLNITREGKEYLKNYPLILNCIWFAYTIMFPMLYLLCVIVKLCFELKSGGYLMKILHFLCGSGCVIITAFYLDFIHRKKPNI